MAKANSMGKKILYILACLIILSWVLKYWWISSGSNEWQLEIDKDGVQVYSLKTPGSYMKQFKTIKRTKMSINQLAAGFLLDNHSLENCKKWLPTCIGDEVIEPYSDAKQGDTILWTLEFGPFSNREFLLRNYARQHDDGIVSVDIMAIANKQPRNDCCFRIVHMHNRWQFKPLDNGEVEIQFLQDAKIGGFFPDFLINFGAADQAYTMFSQQLDGFLDKDKYRQATFDFIK